MSNEINTCRDGAGYDRDPYTPGRISDANVLYDAWLAARKDSDWKPKVQIFEMDWLANITELQREVNDRTYKPSKPTEFLTFERGKERTIRGEQVRDRVVEHALNDNAVIPSIRPYLIYDNGASLKGRGVDFTRKRLVKHLARYYSQHGNDGYILLMDFSKYYDNIWHDVLLDQFHRYVKDDTATWLLDTIVDGFKVDVSYMTDEEYAGCMQTPFSSLEYAHISRDQKSGEKYMRKHLDIGNQTSQSAGILYPTPIDNYFKIVRGEKFYARYMDDSYCISDDREHLNDLYQNAIRIASENGIIVNQSKSRIVKLSDYWRFLQVQYSLTDTGRIIRKINPKQVTVMRRKMKELAPRMQEKEFHDWTFSWLKSHRKYLSNRQYGNIRRLYYELLEVTI